MQILRAWNDSVFLLWGDCRGAVCWVGGDYRALALPGEWELGHIGHIGHIGLGE